MYMYVCMYVHKVYMYMYMYNYKYLFNGYLIISGLDDITEEECLNRKCCWNVKQVANNHFDIDF